MIDIETLQHHIIALLQAFLKKEHPDNSIEKNKKTSFIIGLSGGADSVFLLRQLIEVQKKLPVELIVAHLQHDWRGEADIQDLLPFSSRHLFSPFYNRHSIKHYSY
jgi:tRNA(Ile)-lysidine synthase TilS/MesJ